MSDSFSIATFLFLLGCLLVGVLFAWLMYGNTKQLDKRLRYALALARALVVMIIGFLLFFPLIRTVVYNPEKPIVIIAQDNSLSIGDIAPEGFNKQQYEADMNTLAARLGEMYELKVYNFSDSVKKGFDFSNKGQLSNPTQLISKLNDEYLNRNVGAIILASDGIFNRGGSPLYELEKLKAPVYTIALGDTIPKKDLLIANVNHNNLVYLNNEFTIEVQVQAFAAKGVQSQIYVFENGKKIYEDQLLVTADAFVKNVSIKLKATKLGLQKYTVQLSPVPNEVSDKNNIENLFVEVIDTRMKVLIAAAGPHPDITALKQAISLNKNFEVKIALAEELNALQLNDFGVVVLYQLPSAVYDASSFIHKLASVPVSVWYILGAQSDLNTFNRIQKQVSFAGNNTVQEAYSHVNPGFTAFNLDELMIKRIESFDPLLAPFGRPAVNGNAAIALNQRIGKINTDFPALFFMMDNGRKTAFLIGEGLWRWKLSEAGEVATGDATVFNSLLSKTVQYLSLKDDKRKFKVYAAKNTFDENENVLLNAVLYNDSYVSVNTPDVGIAIKNDRGKEYKFLFSRTDAAYQLDAGALPPGNYTYVATTVLGNKKETVQGVFFVNAVIAEYHQTIANHQLLNTMAVQTNGKMYMPGQLLKLVDEIKANGQIKTLTYEDRRYEELINYKWLFAMLITLLTLEWFFRKRNGEI